MGGSRVINVKRLRTCDAHHDDINLWRLKRCVCILLESVFFHKIPESALSHDGELKKKAAPFYLCMHASY